MKSISSAFLPSVLPALALLTLGGCASTSGLTTTEPDGVYYSSKDRTTELATASTATPSGEVASSDDPNAVANPEYRSGGNSANQNGSASDEYYDDDYAYSARIRRFHQPSYRGLGLGYYDYAYTDYYWYNSSPAFYGYDIYGGYPYYGNSWAFGPSYYGGFDPFWGYGARPFVSIGFGWGSPWGYGYSPFGYGGYGGYGRGFYDGYYAGSYGYPGYGYSGYGYGGFRNGYRSTSNVRYAPRHDRSSEATNTGGRNVSGRRDVITTGGRTASNTGAMSAPGNETVPTRRSRVSGGADATPNTSGVVSGGSGSPADGRVRSSRIVESSPTDQPAVQPGRGRLYRIVDNPSTAQPEEMTGRVRGNNPEQLSSPTEYGRPPRTSAGDQQMSQPQQQQLSDYAQPRTRRERVIYDQAAQPQQSAPQPQSQPIERPIRRERAYEPAPQRSYEAPSRSDDGGSRFGGGGFNGGGGNSGGGNSGGGSPRGGGRVR
jgi:hypothetical protein